MDDRQNELPPPEGAEQEDAVELMRAWVIDGVINFQIHDGILDQPEQFGVMLAELVLESSFMRHGEDEEAVTDAIERIMSGFTARLTDAQDPEEEDDEDI